MNTDKGDNVDETVASEMDVKLNQISQTSVTELNPVLLTPISTQDVNKPDETAALMQLLLTKFDNFNKKLDEQKRDSDEIKTQNVQIKSDFNVKLEELKTEIKRRNDNLDKQYDKVIKKLDEKLI